MKIVVLEAASIGTDVSWDGLREFGELVLYQTTRDEEIAARISDADVIIPNKCQIREENLCQAKKLQLICEAATGYNNIDLDACKEHQITVTNVKGYSTEAVAQHTFAMLLHLLAKMDYYSTHVESGEYSQGESFTMMGPAIHELAGRTLGIIGMGNIGRCVAEIATVFGMKVIYYSASGRVYDVPYPAVDFDTLLSLSDVVSCHAPLNDRTRGLMNQEAFQKMKPSAVFLNLGRGPIVDETALASALEKGEIQAAALDVFELEPLPQESPLLQIRNRDRLLMTPHVAWASVEARQRLVADVKESIRCYFEGRPRSIVG